MYKKPIFILTVLTALFLPTFAIASGAIGELAFSIGGTYPQGDYVKYADPGWNIGGRATFRIPGAELVGGWLDLGYTEFSREETDIGVHAPPFILDGIQSVTQHVVSVHTGIQLGTFTRRGFFRPRFAAGPGLYIFGTTTSVKILGDEDDLASETTNQTKFGWRATGGFDLFFVTKWGLTFDFVYDHVFDLSHSLEYLENGTLAQTGRAARFHGFMIGMTFPFSTLDN